MLFLSHIAIFWFWSWSNGESPEMSESRYSKNWIISHHSIISFSFPPLPLLCQKGLSLDQLPPPCSCRIQQLSLSKSLQFLCSDSWHLHLRGEFLHLRMEHLSCHRSAILFGGEELRSWESFSTEPWLRKTDFSKNVKAHRRRKNKKTPNKSIHFESTNRSLGWTCSNFFNKISQQTPNPPFAALATPNRNPVFLWAAITQGLS